MWCFLVANKHNFLSGNINEKGHDKTLEECTNFFLLFFFLIVGSYGLDLTAISTCWSLNCRAGAFGETLLHWHSVFGWQVWIFASSSQIRQQQFRIFKVVLKTAFKWFSFIKPNLTFFSFMRSKYKLISIFCVVFAVKIGKRITIMDELVTLDFSNRKCWLSYGHPDRKRFIINVRTGRQYLSTSSFYFFTAWYIREHPLKCTINVYILPFLTSPIAPHTSNKKTSGKAKSPRTESSASAKSSGFFLSLPASTMVVAVKKMGQKSVHR